MSTALLWFHNDLRLGDNPALVKAIESGKPVIPLFIWDENDSDLHTGRAAMWWLHQSLDKLSSRIEGLGNKLILRKGNPKDIIKEIIDEHNVSTIYLNRRFEPPIIKRDQHILSDIDHTVTNGNLLFNPEDIRTMQDKQYTVFTPFWKNCKAKSEPHEPLPTPSSIPAPKKLPDSLSLDQMQLLPKIKWYTTFEKKWRPGEEEANRILIHFLKSEARKYGKQRNIPGVRGTSRLSPYLRFGEISPNTIWHESKPYDNPGTEHFVREVGWREFSYHLMVNFPFLANNALRENFENFPWRDSEEDYTAWTKGMTGYPIVDAGMRELYATGWMHNRVRMIVASFLVKHLLIDWKKGERWFFDTLVDGDFCSNNAGWQWTAGCGADAAPYYRIFNPILQGKKFDTAARYVRRWVPEIADIPNESIHAPWELSEDQLQSYGVTLGKTYPKPIVNHEFARKRALDTFDKIAPKK